MLIITLAGSGYVPIAHSAIMNGPANGLATFPLTHTIAMDVLYLVGVFFYLTHLPESKFPGKYDVWVSILCPFTL